MDELMENKSFADGIIVGISLYQQKVISAHERKEGLLIDGDLYYLESGKERLERTLDEICR